MNLAVQDRDATLTHAALYWDDELDMWQLLSLGRSEEEIISRVDYWEGKGTKNIKMFVLENL